MAHREKSAAYQFLKKHGVELDKHYRDYSTEELVGAARVLSERIGEPLPEEVTPVSDLPAAPRDEVAEQNELASKLADVGSKLDKLIELQLMAAQNQAPVYAAPAQPATPPPPPAPVPSNPEPQRVKPLAQTQFDPREHAGVTSNTHVDDDVIEVDEYGNKWFQREVAKPAFPKPRGRRVLRAMEAGVVQETVQVGEYTETFEVQGDPSTARATEIKITLPSYQTGIYKSPNFPFKIHTYNGQRAFDLEDVQAFYGAADLVPDTIKKVYVSNDLCYDITTTVRAINEEYRESVLNGGKR